MLFLLLLLLLWVLLLVVLLGGGGGGNCLLILVRGKLVAIVAVATVAVVVIMAMVVVTVVIALLRLRLRQLLRLLLVRVLRQLQLMRMLRQRRRRHGAGAGMIGLADGVGHQLSMQINRVRVELIDEARDAARRGGRRQERIGIVNASCAAVDRRRGVRRQDAGTGSEERMIRLRVLLLEGHRWRVPRR